MTVGTESAKMLQKASKTVLLLVTALLCSCGEVLFHEFHSVEGRKWSRGNVLSYYYDGSLTTADDAGYLLSVEARTDVSYSYKNLVVRVETFDGEGGELLSADVRNRAITCTTSSACGCKSVKSCVDGIRAGIYNGNAQVHLLEKPIV